MRVKLELQRRPHKEEKLQLGGAGTQETEEVAEK